jgi:hypothetical protein
LTRSAAKGSCCDDVEPARVKVYTHDGTKWRVHRVWGAGRGRPHLGRLWVSPVGIVFLGFELLMAAGNLIARTFFDHPWPLRARCLDQEKRWLVKGWRESEQALAFIARTIHASGKPPAYVPGDVTPFD